MGEVDLQKVQQIAIPNKCKSLSHYVVKTTVNALKVTMQVQLPSIWIHQ